MGEANSAPASSILPRRPTYAAALSSLQGTVDTLTAYAWYESCTKTFHIHSMKRSSISPIPLHIPLNYAHGRKQGSRDLGCCN